MGVTEHLESANYRAAPDRRDRGAFTAKWATMGAVEVVNPARSNAWQRDDAILPTVGREQTTEDRSVKPSGLGNRLIFRFSRWDVGVRPRTRSSTRRSVFRLVLLGWLVINVVWAGLMFAIGGFPRGSLPDDQFFGFEPSWRHALELTVGFAVASGCGLAIVAFSLARPDDSDG